MSRVALKVVGAQGQGLLSIGELLGKGLKREGYCIFGYREYMSLIEGGHASYQLDIDTVPVRSSLTHVDILLTLNYQGITRYLRPSHHGPTVIREGGYLIHDVPDWKFSEEDQKLLQERAITVIQLPTERILTELKAPLILRNTLLTGFLWAVLGRSQDTLKSMVGERYAKKEKLIPANLACVEKGFEFHQSLEHTVSLQLPEANSDWKDYLLITGNEALGLGAIHAGVRFYAGYPMTPASTLLEYLAAKQNETGMIVKQAEDEITAAQMVAGAFHMGARAMTGTSGGGFDLMTETLSMIGMVESPMVFVLAQRPGPATGVPTWTTQGDLFLAVYAAHGEFPRCVMALSDGEDAFTLTGEAYNIAERFQIPVILLTDKHLAEGLYCIPSYDLTRYVPDRGSLVTDEKELQELQPSDRYRITESGISQRWVPGQKAVGFDANGDEHTEDGTVTEDASPVRDMLAKRMRKLETLRKALPEPELNRIENGKLKVVNTLCDLDILVVGWGSTKGVILDVLQCEECKGRKIGYLHYTYLWPLRTSTFEKLHARAKRTILIEGNYQGQLGVFLRQETGIALEEKILKYDGRPFFFEEVRDALFSNEKIVPHQDVALTSQASSSSPHLSS